MTADFSVIFGALADTRRRAILKLLSAGSLPVHEIAEEFSVSRPAISRHLRVLREAGLVHEEKRGRKRLYALDLEPLDAAVDHLRSYRSSPGPSADAKTPDPEDSWRTW